MPDVGRNDRSKQALWNAEGGILWRFIQLGWAEVGGLFLFVAIVGCIENTEVESGLDRSYFRCSVQPVLDESCGFLACHGDVVRPLRVYARNRLRLDADPTDLNESLSEEELDANFTSAAAFADEFLLSQKPLDEDADGRYHQGRERYGYGDVFLSENERGHQILRGWLEGRTSHDDCVYEGSEP